MKTRTYLTLAANISVLEFDARAAEVSKIRKKYSKIWKYFDIAFFCFYISCSISGMV